MSSYSFRKRINLRIVTIFRILVASFLLSGGFVFQPSSQCLVLAQGGKENEKNKEDKENDKDKNKKNYSESPSEHPSGQPSIYPSRSPSWYPSQAPIVPTNFPSNIPTSSPTRKAFEATLPDIKIDIRVKVDDIFSFAALLLDGDANGISNASTLSNRDGLNAFFESFVMDLLIASEVVTSSSLDSVDIEIKFLPLDDEDNNQGTVSSSSSTTTSIATNVTPVRIAIEGKMIYHIEADDGEMRDDVDISHSVMLLEDKMSHTLAVYFSFWSTDEMISRLSEYGLTDPHITAVRVDDKLILVAADSNPPNGDTNSDNNNEADIGNDSDNGNLLVAPADTVTGVEIDDSSLTAKSGRRDLRRTGPFFTLVAIAGSTMALLFSAVLA